MFDEKEYTKSQLKVILKVRSGTSDMSCINDLDPSKYNAQQMNVISRFRHDSKITKNVDDLDPSIYSAKHMSAISFIRGNCFGDLSSVEDLDPKKFTSDQMSVIAKYRKDRDIKNSDFEGVDLENYDRNDFEKLINSHKDLSNIKIISIKDKINTSIERLKETLLEEDYETLFNGPVSNEKLNELSLKIGEDIPESLSVLLNKHDGQKYNNFSFFENYKFLSSDMIMKEWSIWNDLLLKGAFKDLKSRSYSGIKKSWWNPAWIPFAANDCGDCICIDMSPTKSGKVGQIITMWHDSPSRKILSDSLCEWIEILIEKSISDKKVTDYNKEYLHWAMDASDSGLHAKAITMFTNYLSQNSESTQAITERVRVYLEINEYELAEKDLTTMFEIISRKLSITKLLIDKCKDQGDVQKLSEQNQILISLNNSEKEAKKLFKEVSNYYESKGFV